MLSYAFQILRQSNYEEVMSEKFDMVQDLFAAILAKGISPPLTCTLKTQKTVMFSWNDGIK